jgi:small subunit ribosomal protein S1
MAAEWMSGAKGESNPMAQMLESYLSCQDLERGQTVSGTVVRIGSNEIIVDVNAKCEGIVPERDLARLSPEDREAIQVGDKVLVYIINPEDGRGNIVLSLSEAQLAQDWRKAQRLLKSQETIERYIVGCNKGGVIVRVGRIRGFVPGSQLAVSRVANHTSTETDANSRWAGLIGTPLQLKVIEVDQERNRLILSERAAQREQRKSQRQTLLDQLTEGDIRQGRVINIVDFGAFIDLGGIDGLAHLSELSWKRISHPSEVIEIGQNVQVYVLNVDRERQRVSLSLKRLQDDPWLSAEERYHEGQLVEGTITRLVKWGAFASIIGDEAIEGLIHISELAEGPVIHPREILRPGQVVTLRVISMDVKHHRLALSLKQVDAREFVGQDWRVALETSATLSEAIEPSTSPGLSDAHR